MTPIPDERLKEWRDLSEKHPDAFISGEKFGELLDEIEALRKALLLISKQPICSMAMSGAVGIARAALSPPPPPSRSAPDTD